MSQEEEVCQPTWPTEERETGETAIKKKKRDAGKIKMKNTQK